MSPSAHYRRGDRVVADLDVFEGDVVRYDGRLWMAKVKRYRSIPLLPIVAGRPQVSADDLVRVDLDASVVTHTGQNVYGYGGQATFRPRRQKGLRPLVGERP